MKINGVPFHEVKNDPPYPSFTVYRVTLKGGPMDKHQTIVGNSHTVIMNDHRYELKADGDFVYAPEGLN